MKKIILLFLILISAVGAHAQLAEEGFEGPWTTGQGPTNWKILQNDIGTTNIWQQNPANNTSIPAFEGVHAAYLDKQNVASGIPEDYLVTPQFNVPLNGELHFYSRLTQMGDQGGIYKVKILPQGADADIISNYVDLQTWTEIQINPLQTTYSEVVVNIPTQYFSSQARIAFVLQGDNVDRWLIDNVKVTSLCAAPNNLSVSNITLTSADLSWNNPLGVTEWEIEYVGDEQAPTGTGTVFNGTLPYTLNNLEIGTSYKYFVRSLCDDGGISAWQGPYFFVTKNYGQTCEAPLVVESLPYSKPGNTVNFADFYNGTPGAQCGTIANNYLYGNDVVYSYTATFNGEISLKGENLTSNTGGMFVYTSCGDIGVNCYAGDISDFTDHMEIYMQVTSGTTYYILLSSQNTVSMGYQLTIQQESCDPPAALSSANPTTSSLNISWQEAANATAWQYKLQPFGGGIPLGSGTNTSQSSVTVNGLQDSAIYDLYVRSNCGDGTFSSWSGPKKMYTACGITELPLIEGFNTDSQTEYCWTIYNYENDFNTWNTNTAYNFYEGNEVASYWVNGGNTNDYLISPAVNLTGNQRLKFRYKNSSDTADVSFSVLMSTTGTDPEDFTTVVVPMASYSYSDYLQKIVNLSSLPTGPVYFAWKIGESEVTAQLLIDQVIIEDHPACSEPYDVTAGDITINSASISWISGNAETAWEIIMQNPGLAAPGNSSVGTPVTSATYLKTGLTPNTPYAVYVRSNCATDGNSPWAEPLMIRTDCIAFDTPFHEGFETYSQTKYCWQALNSNNDEYKWKYTSDPFDGDQAMSVYDNAADSDDMLISPQINLTGNQRLKYHYKTSEAGGVKVLISTTGTDPADFTEVLIPETTYLNTAYLEKKISLTAYNGPVYIAFKVSAGSSAGYIYIDNVIVEDFPLCTEPANLTTGVMTDTTAELSWIQGLNEQDWEVLVQLSGGDVPAAATVGEAAPDMTFVKTGLEANTTYEYYVRSACGANGNSVWMGPVSFTTECAVFSVPFQEGFNSDSPTFACWEIINANNDDYNWQPTYDPFEGDRGVYIFDYESNNDWLISPKINLTGNQRLKFHHKSSQDDSAFSILLSTTGKNPEDFTQVILPETLYNNSFVYTEEKISLAGYSGPVYIAWVVNDGGPWPTPINIDNVIIEDQPLCTEPINLILGEVTASTAQLSWTQGFDETNWQVLVQPEGGPVPTDTTVGDLSAAATFTKNGLSDNTNYEFYVRSDCNTGSNGNSIWVGPLPFTTLCTAFDVPYFEDFEENSVSEACWDKINIDQMGGWNTNVATSYIYPEQQAVADTGDLTDDILVSPLINLNGNQRLKYQQKAINTTAYSVLLSTTGKNPEDFTEVLLPMGTYDNAIYEKRILSLANYTGPVYIGFKTGGGFGYPSSVYIDKVVIEDIPVCAEPYNQTVTDITTTSAQLSWTPGSNETQWEVYVQITGSGQPQGAGIPVNAFPYIATTLTNGNPMVSGAGYDFFVRAICSDTDTSIWSDAKKFTTIITNDDCLGATDIPVNTDEGCQVYASGTVNGATTSPQESSCYGLGYGDVWFKFTAGAALHTVSLKNIKGSIEFMKFAAYTGTCDNLTQLGDCVGATNAETKKETILLNDLVIGQTYFVRVSVDNAYFNNDTTFDICVGLPRMSVKNAEPFCASDNPDYAIIVDNVNKEMELADYGALGCLESTPNPVWYFMEISGSGDLDFQLVQNTAFNAMGQPVGEELDVDFISYGPFTSTTQASQLIDFIGCPTCPSNIEDLSFYPEGNIIDCSYSDYAVENFSINNAQVGEIYVVLITNYDGDAGQIKLQQLPSSTGSTNCEILYKVSLGEDMTLCGVNDTTITATITTSNVNTGTINYEWFMDGQPFDPSVVTTTALSQTVSISDTGAHIYRVEATIENASLTTPVKDEVTVTIGPAIDLAPLPVLLCNDNGAAVIDLEELNEGVLGSLNPTLFSVSYYLQEADAQAGTNPVDITVPFSTSGQLLYVRVESIEVPTCFDIAPLPLNVNTVAIAIQYQESPFCAGNGSAQVLQTGNTGGTYTSTQGLDINPLTGEVNLVTSTSGTYTVSYTIPGYTIPENGVQCNVADTTITINAPTVPVTGFIYNATTYCSDDANPILETMTGFTPGGVYTSAQGLSLDSQTGAIDLLESIPGTYVVTYTVSQNWETCNTQSNTDFTITINPTPQFNLGGPYIVCETLNLTISVNAENFDAQAASYNWTFNGNAIEGNSASLLANDFGVYGVTVNVNGCSSVRTIEVVKDITIVELAFEEGCNDKDEYVLKVLPVDGSFDPDNVTYVWTGPDGFSSDKQEFTVPVKGTYIVTVTTDNGCIGESFNDVLQTYCDIPKGISPNGDGMNDNFDLSGLDVKQVEIFNRYGQQVYSQSSYTNQWHGQNNKGDELPTGTYYYVIERHNGETKTGWVYINRQN
jgi:gliding motility-associated-like protein